MLLILFFNCDSLWALYSHFLSLFLYYLILYASCIHYHQSGTSLELMDRTNSMRFQCATHACLKQRIRCKLPFHVSDRHAVVEIILESPVKKTLLMLDVLRMDSYKLSPVSYSVAVTRGGETKRVSCCVATNVFMLCSQSAYGLSRHTSVMLCSQDAEMSSTLHLQGYNLHRTSAFTKSSLTSLSSAASSSLHFLVAAFFIVSSDAASISVAAMRRIPAIPGCMTGPNASAAMRRIPAIPALRFSLQRGCLCASALCQCLCRSK